MEPSEPTEPVRECAKADPSRQIERATANRPISIPCVEDDVAVQQACRDTRRLVVVKREPTLILARLEDVIVPVSASGSTISIGIPAKLFDTTYAEPNPSRHFDVSADGQRFLMLKASATADPNATPLSMVLVEHWLEELKQRVPVK